MTQLKLSYFDFDGGRGEAARLALAIRGVAFDDDRIPMAQWPGRKAAMPFQAIPVLEIDGRALTQSDAINRYVGKLTGLYPEDDLQAAYCDEVLAATEDLFIALVSTFNLAGEELKAAREALIEGPMPIFLRGLDALLEARGGKYFAGDQLTVADLKAFVITRALGSGNFDHIPKDIVGRLAPNLVEHSARITSEPAIAEHYR